MSVSHCPNQCDEAVFLWRWCVSELSPVCAVVGGVLAQEVIKAISAKDRPYMNSFLYNGQQNTGIVEQLRP